MRRVGAMFPNADRGKRRSRWPSGRQYRARRRRPPCRGGWRTWSAHRGASGRGDVADCIRREEVDALADAIGAADRQGRDDVAKLVTLQRRQWSVTGTQRFAAEPSESWDPCARQDQRPGVLRDAVEETLPVGRIVD